ncbi:Similar to FKBP46: 46 kDa FK506-binding nuclear protein (Spodoptera frugiperda) [Cotesia congregata]|uniref:peptidylprolyl isomerase n=1 Tax=Cotesia congregata TaxID=51543 RepID=A0A8J2HG66_COTCN|nr:Similar to FKBP46: 46 kDa FK506-binding nuclear protein (Spodoptera frugiperda) [Cotesia congregata]
MFWGLIMEPNKRYTQTVEKAFHVSMATLDVTTADDAVVQVMLCYDNRNYLLCNLLKSSSQAQLDLNFKEGTRISFTSNGRGHVHLTGYLIPDELDDLEQDLEEEEIPELNQSQETAKQNNLVNGKDKGEIKKKNNEEQKPQNEQLAKKRTLTGGVAIEELKVGTGAPAKSGKFISVYYVGRLKNGKKFDSTTSGDGFKFRLGKGEVIKGWDIGNIRSLEHCH